MTRQMMKYICKIFREIVDRDHAHHAEELEALTSRFVAMKLFHGQAALACGDLGQAVALLRAERLRQQWSLQEFLATVGMTRSTLNRIENQQRNPSIDTLERLAAALGKKLVVALVELDDQNEESADENEKTTEQNASTSLES